MLDLVLHNATQTRTYGEKFFHRVCTAAVPYLGTPKGQTVELAISLISPARMRRLNQKHRGLDRSTDVLSFPLPTPVIKGYNRVGLGDIFISLPDVTAKAKANHKTVRQQLAWTVVHGLLHLAGHDHQASPARAKKMFALEKKILCLLPI